MRAMLHGPVVILALTFAACGGTPPAQGASASGGAAPAAAEPAAEAPAPPPEVQLAPGTVVEVRLTRALSTAHDRAGDPFDAILDRPVAVDGREVLPRGTRFQGHVTTSDASGRLKGRAVMGLTLDSFALNGRRYRIETSLDTRASEAHKKRNIEIIGGGAGVGTLIGALTGGGKGAGIGAAVGAAAGTGTAAATGRRNVEVPAETLFRFTLRAAVKVGA